MRLAEWGWRIDRECEIKIQNQNQKHQLGWDHSPFTIHRLVFFFFFFFRLRITVRKISKQLPLFNLSLTRLRFQSPISPLLLDYLTILFYFISSNHYKIVAVTIMRFFLFSGTIYLNRGVKICNRGWSCSNNKPSCSKPCFSSSRCTTLACSPLPCLRLVFSSIFFFLFPLFPVFQLILHFPVEFLHRKPIAFAVLFHFRRERK